MPYEEKIKSFRKWAVSMGCPFNALPSEDALRSVFKSGHCELFMQMMERVQPRQYVKEVRENLLIAKLAKYEGKLVPICERSFLPQEMQIYLKMQDLDKKKEDALARLADAKKQFDEDAAYIKSKSTQLIAAKHKYNLQTSRVNILKLKLESLEKIYQEEEKIQARILAATPVKLTSENSSEKLAMQAVKQALKELDNFYEICNAEDHNGHNLAEEKARLWAKMREIFSNTPNVLIFNASMKIMDELLLEANEFKKCNADGVNGSLSKQRLDNYTVKLLKTKADLMGIVAKYMCAKKDVAKLEEEYVQKYETFVEELQKKVNNGEGEEITEEIISEYLLQYNMHNFYKARNDCLSQHIDKLQLEVDAGAKQLENHEMMIASLKQLYSERNTTINDIHQDIVQLSQIKDKILYSKNLLQNMIDDMNQTSKTQMLSNKLKGNMSMMGMDSFCLGNKSVLSSTKLDIDPNTTVMNNTLRHSFDNTLIPGACTANTTALMPFTGAAPPTLPSHVQEVNTFGETPLDKLSCIPSVCLNLLSANPLIVESQELASTIQLVPGHLLTPRGVEQEVRKRILWASAIAAHSSDIKLNLEPLIVDPHDLEMKARRQKDEIARYQESIEALGVKTQQRVDKAKRIYQFIVDNPLAKYVPPTRTYKNATFAEYEAEFNLYYRMAKASGSSSKPK